MRAMIIVVFLGAAGWLMADGAESVTNNAAKKKCDTKAAKGGDVVKVADAVVEHTNGVVGGPHDFSDPETGRGDACQGCHVPHMQALRLVAPAATTQPAVVQQAAEPIQKPTYEMYRITGQRRVFEPDRYMPGATSLMCLSCHDGSVATSTIGAAHSMLAGVREGFSMPDGFAWRDHPIGVPYPTDRRTFHPQSTVEKKGIRLVDGRMECISCHEPHGGNGFEHLLSASNRRSSLCLTCHIK